MWLRKRAAQSPAEATLELYDTAASKKCRTPRLPVHRPHRWHPWGAAATCARWRERRQRWRAPGPWSGDVLARLNPAYQAPPHGGACGAGGAAVPPCRPGRSLGQGPARGCSGRLSLSLRAHPSDMLATAAVTRSPTVEMGRSCATGQRTAGGAGWLQMRMRAAGGAMLGCPTGAAWAAGTLSGPPKGASVVQNKNNPLHHFGVTAAIFGVEHTPSELKEGLRKDRPGTFKIAASSLESTRNKKPMETGRSNRPGWYSVAPTTHPRSQPREEETAAHRSSLETGGSPFPFRAG